MKNKYCKLVVLFLFVLMVLSCATTQLIVRSPDGKRLAYTQKKSVVIDSVKSKNYEGVNHISFSPNSKRIAYAAKLNKMWFVIIDGKEDKQYEEVNHISFSPDSKKIAYAAKLNKMWFVVIDGKEDNQYDGVSNIIFSNDSEQYIYKAKLEKNWYYVINGNLEKISFEKGSNIANNTLSNIIFTPDNKHHAYLVSFNDIMTGGNSAYYVIDGIEGKHFNKVSPLEVSKETNQMTYWGLEVNGYGFMKNAYYKYVNGKQVEKTKHAPSHWDGY